jgi:hypothetical protein
MELTVTVDARSTLDKMARRVVVDASDYDVTPDGWRSLPEFATLKLGTNPPESVALLKYSHDDVQATYVQEGVPHSKAWKLKLWND